MNHEYDFKFGHMEIRNTCAVFTSGEGVHIDTNDTKVVWAKLEEIFGEKKFGFIANRINSYSVNPLAVAKMFSHENIVAGAIVSQTELGEKVSAMERKLIKEAETNHFSDINAAINWVEKIVAS